MKFKFSFHSTDNPAIKWTLAPSILLCVAFAFTTSTVSAQVVPPTEVGPVFTIDFDGTGAPSVFVDAIALTNEFAGEGVNFSGPGVFDGGAILNESSGFDILARSGTDFFAFNSNISGEYQNGGTPRGPATISFDSLVNFVSIFASGGSDTASFTIDAFLQDEMVGSQTITAPAGIWTELLISSDAVTGNSGFDSVVVSEDGDGAFVFDDLSFGTAVPEPSSALIVVLCTGLASITRRRTR